MITYLLSRLRTPAACWLALGGLPLAAQAQTADPVRVLFVGNSFTHGKLDSVRLYNAANITDENYGQTGARAESSYTGPWGGTPGIFKKFTDQAGLRYEVHIEAISGQPLETHYNSALSVIKQATWDKVVLQDQSTYPIPDSRKGNRKSFYTYATKLEQAVHQANAQAQVYLYETWARADQTYPSGQPYSGQPIDTMAQDLHNGYYTQYRTNGHYAGVAPAGDAWMRAIATGVAMRNPYSPDVSKLSLWWRTGTSGPGNGNSGNDKYHPSKWGSYLNACVLFYTLTGVDPRTLGSTEQAAADLAIRPDAAVALQQLAYQQGQEAVAPLPVQLAAFEARPTTTTAVVLTWTTASEVNSDHFVVERSADGKRFEPIGQVLGAGSDATTHRYAFTDGAAPAAGCYYRLRLVDRDGSAAFSPVRPVAARASQLRVYPNPTRGEAVVLTGTAPSAVVRVCDALGKVVLAATADAGGVVTLRGLRTGLYQVQAGTRTVRLSVE